MNFDDFNKLYKYLESKIYPNVQCKWENVSTETILIDRYLSTVDDNRVYKLLTVPYLVEPESFLKRYKENCIIFYNTPEPKDGLLFIHQLPPDNNYETYVHIHSRLFCWIENEKVHGYIQPSIFYKNYKDCLSFMKRNFDIAATGNTEEKVVGFNLKSINEDI
jgi:hypothetical protein